jgi:hypothetical protein
MAMASVEGRASAEPASAAVCKNCRRSHGRFIITSSGVGRAFGERLPVSSDENTVKLDIGTTLL